MKTFQDREVLVVDPEGLSFLAETAIREISFKLRPAHLKQVAAILKDPLATDNDRRIAYTLLKMPQLLFTVFFHSAKTRERA